MVAQLLAGAALSTIQSFPALAGNIAKAGAAGKSFVRDLTSVSNSIEEISQAGQIAFAGIEGAIRLATEANNNFEKSIISTLGLLGNQTGFTDLLGNDIENVEAKLRALRGPVEELLRGFEETALTLTGLTSQDLVQSFNVVTRNFSEIKGQSKTFTDDLEAAAKVAERFAVASQALGLPTEQLGQEIRSFLTGDINSDSIVSQSLGFTGAEIDQLKAQGTLIDELIKRTESLAVAANLGAKTFDGAFSNIVDFFQILNREATTNIFESLTNTANEFFSFLNENRSVITDVTTQYADLTGRGLGALGNLLKEVGRLLIILEPLFRGAFVAIVEVVKILADGLGAALKLVNDLLFGIADVFVTAFQTDAVQDFISTLVDGAGQVQKAWLAATGQLEKVNEQAEQARSFFNSGAGLVEQQASASSIIEFNSVNTTSERKNDIREDRSNSVRERRQKLNALDAQPLQGREREERDNFVKREREAIEKEIEQLADAGIVNYSLESDKSKLAADAQKTINLLENAFADLQNNLTPVDLDNLIKTNRTAGVARLQTEYDRLKDSIKEIEKSIESLTGTERTNAEVSVKALKQQAELREKIAQQNNIQLAETLKGQRLQTQPAVDQSLITSINRVVGPDGLLTQASESGFGDLKQLTDGVNNLFEKVATGLETGAITIEQAKSALQSVADADFLNPEQRVKAFVELEKVSKRALTAIKNIQQISDLKVDLQVEQGSIGSAEAAVQKAENALLSLNAQIRETEELLANAANPAQATELQQQLSELTANRDVKQAQIQNLIADEAIGNLDKQLAKADRRLAEFRANQELALQQAINAGAITDGDSVFVKLANEIEAASIELKKLQVEAKELANLPTPTTSEGQRERQIRIDENRTQQLKLQTQILQTQREREKEILQARQRLLEIDNEITSVRQQSEFDVRQSNLDFETQALERQLSITQALANLDNARSELAKSRIAIELAENTERQSLLQKQADGSINAQEQQALNELGGGSEQEVAERIFELKQQQIAAELEAVSRRLQIEQQIFEIEQRKLDLALQQQELALERQRSARAETEAQLKLEREKIQADDSLTTEEKTKQLELNQEILNASKKTAEVENKQLETVKEQRREQAGITEVEREQLRVQQQQTIEQANASAKVNNRQAQQERFNSLQKRQEPKQSLQAGEKNPLPTTLYKAGRGPIIAQPDIRNDPAPQISVPARQQSPEEIAKLERENAALRADIQRQLSARPATANNTVVNNNFPDLTASRSAARLQGR